MGGWSGGTYTRFRNWVTDKGNSVNPQAALFDQEDDGFAGGLNNCVTKDGLNKPSAAMDWNNQNLTGINLLSAVNLTVTGATVPTNGLYLPAANAIGLTTNGNLRVQIDSTGIYLYQSAAAQATLNSNVATNASLHLYSLGGVNKGRVGAEGTAGTTITGSAAVTCSYFPQEAPGLSARMGEILHSRCPPVTVYHRPSMRVQISRKLVSEIWSL
jgi:hypothetical protein